MLLRNTRWADKQRKLEMRRQRRQRRLLRAAARLATSASVDETPLLDCEGTAASASQTTSSTIHPTTHSVAPDSSLLDPTNGTQPAPSATSLDDASFDMPDLELQVSHTEGDVISLATKNGVLVRELPRSSLLQTTSPVTRNTDHCITPRRMQLPWCLGIRHRLTT